MNLNQAFLLLKTFTEKGMGHGLVTSEEEKADLEDALQIVGDEINYEEEDNADPDREETKPARKPAGKKR